MDTTALPQGAEELRPERHPATSTTRHEDKLPSYVVADTDLEMGTSLGNSTCWVTTKGTGDIESIFSTYLGQKVMGAVCVRYSGSGRRMELPSQEGGVPTAQPAPAHNGAGRLAGQIQLYRQTPGRFVLHPAYQHHEYDLPGGIHVEETAFVPRVQVPGQTRAEYEHLGMASPIVYQAIRVRNDGAQPAHLSCYGYADLHGATPADVGGTYDPALGHGALVQDHATFSGIVR